MSAKLPTVEIKGLSKTIFQRLEDYFHEMVTYRLSTGDVDRAQAVNECYIAELIAYIECKQGNLVDYEYYLNNLYLIRRHLYPYINEAHNRRCEEEERKHNQAVKYYVAKCNLLRLTYGPRWWM